MLYSSSLTLIISSQGVKEAAGEAEVKEAGV